ncbi:MAG: sigma-70 family RNA polymerase sigma factor [Planctomycetota bacterium]|nr:sigma-70 family RNA polymerase sigma factor [Planctomycetota bacterium]
MTDAQLIDEALAGQSSSFGQLVTRYQDRLYNTLVHVLGNAEDASDVAQDAFVQAFIKLASFRKHSAFYTWLYRIAFNLAISSRRRAKPTISIDQMREIAGNEPLSQVDGALTMLDRQERVTQVRTALCRLSDEYRAVVVLREIDGCSYDEISEILTLPIGTVRSRLFRARVELRELLKENYQEDLKL